MYLPIETGDFPANAMLVYRSCIRKGQVSQTGDCLKPRLSRICPLPSFPQFHHLLNHVDLAAWILKQQHSAPAWWISSMAKIREERTCQDTSSGFFKWLSSYDSSVFSPLRCVAVTRCLMRCLSIFGQKWLLRDHGRWFQLSVCPDEAIIKQWSLRFVVLGAWENLHVPLGTRALNLGVR